ncbi:MAG: hypothetical protein V7776_09890 [Halopseudomonas aestusnigri]
MINGHVDCAAELAENSAFFFTAGKVSFFFWFTVTTKALSPVILRKSETIGHLASYISSFQKMLVGLISLVFNIGDAVNIFMPSFGFKAAFVEFLREKSWGNRWS